jgi:hypothetical protein
MLVIEHRDQTSRAGHSTLSRREFKPELRNVTRRRLVRAAVVTATRIGTDTCTRTHGVTLPVASTRTPCRIHCWVARSCCSCSRPAHRVRFVDGHPRRNIPGAARMVLAPEPRLPAVGGAQVFLPVHLRVLLQPLRHRVLSLPHRLHDCRERMARLYHRRVLARLDREHVYEPVRTTPPRHQARRCRDRWGSADVAHANRQRTNISRLTPVGAGVTRHMPGDRVRVRPVVSRALSAT